VPQSKGGNRKKRASRLHAVRFSLKEQASRMHGVYFSGLRPRHCPDIFRTFPTTTIRFERSADASGPPHREIHYIRALPRASAAQRPQPPHVLKLCQMGSLAIQHPETAPALGGKELSPGQMSKKPSFPRNSLVFTIFVEGKPGFLQY